MKPLAGYVALSIVAWTGYHFLNPFEDTTLNRVIAIEITAVSMIGVLISLAWTKHWRLLSLGLLGIFLGMALLYYPPSTDGTALAMRDPPVSSAVTTPHWYLETIRVQFAIGGAYAAAGLLLWAWRHRHEAFPWWRNGESGEPVEHGELRT